MITELGLLDRDLAAHHAAFGVPTQDPQLGVAYPAVFVLDEAGRVVDKRIGENYRAREGALKIVDEALGVALPPAGEPRIAQGRYVSISAVTDSGHYVRWQQTRLHVVFEAEAGWHVYGRPIPDGYIPVTVDLEAPPEVEVHPAQYPPTRPFKVEGLDDQFSVYQGSFEVVVPFAVNVPAGHGSVELKVDVGYQVCSETVCLPPARLRLELSMTEAPAG
ncbi:MAG: hypothetical protein NVS9B11_09690 [Candidatus Dormibacteraceae bacterium]